MEEIVTDRTCEVSRLAAGFQEAAKLPRLKSEKERRIGEIWSESAGDMSRGHDVVPFLVDIGFSSQRRFPDSLCRLSI